MNKLRKLYKGFTLIELLVVIAILGILMLLVMPRFKGHVEKAQLARIKHDVKVMQNKMDESLMNKFDEYVSWDTNQKDLYKLVANENLYETRGVAKKVDRSHLSNSNIKNKTSDASLLNMDMPAMGGPLIPLSGEDNNNNDDLLDEVSKTYKVIPEEYKSKIGTKLKGIFYSNNLGKVYYEPDKPLKNNSKPQYLNCVEPLPDYTFEHKTGTIVKYHGTAQHLIIPSAFLVKNANESEARCWPVRIIGRGAFAQIPLKSVVIPDSVKTIEDEAFKNNDLDDLQIPPSVEEVGEDAFKGNKLEKPVIQKPKEEIDIDDSAFDDNGPNRDTPAKPEFKLPSDKDLGIEVEIERDKDGKPVGGTILDANPKPTPPNFKNPSGGSSGGSSNGNNNTSATIPDKIIVDGEEIPITKIAKGAYQGLGLITVKMPEGLERIEDYAFAGNQLIGVTIPNSVYHIGNYAFAFNETHKGGIFFGPDSIATIKTIIIKNQEQLHKVDKYGNILENNVKVDSYSVNDGVDVRLLDHIFVNSFDNVVIEEETIYIDKSELINKVEEVKKLNKDDYKSGWNELEEVLNEAENIIHDKKATQEQVSNILEMLDQSISNLEEKFKTPGPQEPIASDGTYTFYGEVPVSELISGEELVNITRTGNSTYNINQNEPWLKFTVKNENSITTLFVAKKPINRRVTWSQATKKSSITIQDKQYSVRSLFGTKSRSAAPEGSLSGVTKGSEWNRLLLPIHENALTGNWPLSYYLGEEDKGLFKHSLGNGAEGMYSNEDLGTQIEYGYSWVNESYRTHMSSDAIQRGGDHKRGVAGQIIGIEGATWASKSKYASWRPVIELTEYN
ncbi:MAG TPA: leucine-rich repeat protein [Clostridiales bacterium]|nr:leucine-rich repeat protein [Clostridiales bacterium]